MKKIFLSASLVLAALGASSSLMAQNVPIVTVANGIGLNGSRSGFVIGSYTRAQMAQAGLPDNQARSMLVPDGLMVTLYDGDNFTGQRRTFMGSCPILPGFDQVTSSMKVERAAGATVYLDDNYGATVSAILPYGTYSNEDMMLRGFPSPGGDLISSVKVMTGSMITLYADPNAQGARRTYISDQPYLSNDNFNNIASWVVVAPAACATVYTGASYTGTAAVLPYGVYSNEDMMLRGFPSPGGDLISSLKVTSGSSVKLYADPNASGSERTYTANQADLSTTNFNDVASWVVVGPATGARGELGIGDATAGEAGGRLTLYPNPATSATGFDYIASGAGTMSIAIVDGAGRTVSRFSAALVPGTNHIALPTGGLAAGVYTVRALSGSDVQTARFSLTK